MNAVISATAQYGLVVIGVIAVGLWVSVPTPDKVGLAVRAVIGLVVVAVLVKVASAVHSDPRPFVVNPSVKPLFAHSADNGFPSDHTATGVLVSLVVFTYRRQLGAALLLLAVLVGTARVAAHVHHPQDVVAGVLIGVVAAVVMLVASPPADRGLAHRLRGGVLTP